MRDLISRRLEALSEQEQQCVELLAILGREVTWKFLDLVGGIADEAVGFDFLRAR